MGDKVNITKNLNFDLTKVSKKGISKNAVVGNNEKQIRIFEKFDLNKDGNLNSAELAAAYNYLSKLDGIKGESDGILSKDEYRAGSSALNSELGLSSKDALSSNDLKNFIKNLVKNNNIAQEQIDINVLRALANQNSDLDISNLIDANVLDGDNGRTYILKFKNGTQVHVKSDQSYSVKTMDSNSNATTNYYDSNNVLTQSQVIYYDGTSETDEYTQLANGKRVLSSKTSINEAGDVTSVLRYSNGLPVSELVSIGNEKLLYKADENGSLRLVKSKVGNNRLLEYSYNDNGTVTVKIAEPNKDILQTRGNARDENSIISQTITEHTQNGDIETLINYFEQGRTEQITTPDNVVTKNLYNTDNRKLASTIQKDNQFYCANYDGKGNTYLVVSMNDNMQKLAKAGGFSSVNELFDYNEDLCKGVGANRYFLAGAKIKLKGELSADAPILQNRGTSEQEAAKFNAWQTQQNQLKQIATEEAKAKNEAWQVAYEKNWQAEQTEGKKIAEELNAYLDKHSRATGNREFQKMLLKIRPENVLGVLEDGNLIDKIDDEWQSTTWGSNDDSLIKILETLKTRAKNIGLDSNNVDKLCDRKGFCSDHVDIDKYKAVINKLSVQIKALESTNPTERSMVKSSYRVTLDAMDIQHKVANDNLNAQLAEDGLYADMWDGLKTLVRSDNVDEKVKAELKTYKNYKDDLDKALATGGEDKFKTKFKEIFGIEFEPKLAAAYQVKLNNYSTVSALTDIKNSMNMHLKKNPNDKNPNPSEADYSHLYDAYATFMLKTGSIKSGEDITEPCNKMIKQYMENKGLTYTENYSDEKLACLREMVTKTLKYLNTDIAQKSGGKSLDVLHKDLADSGAAIFGTKKDIMQRVSGYVISQKKGAVYMEATVKGAIALGVTIGTAGTGTGALIAAGSTFMLEAGADTMNHLWSENGTWANFDGEIIKNAAIDAAAVGAAKYATGAINKGVKLSGLRSGINMASELTRDLSAFALKGGSVDKKMIGANLVAAIVFRNSASKMSKVFNESNKVATLNFTQLENLSIKSNINTSGIEINSVKDIKNILASITNLGELNATRREINNIPIESLPNKDEILGLIDARFKELQANPANITTSITSVSSDVRDNAVKALKQPAHIRQDQLEDILAYIPSITDSALFCNTVEQLKQHGIDLNTTSQLRNVLDDKFAEFNIMPSYQVGSDFLLAEADRQVSGAPLKLNSQADYSILNNYINNINDNLGQLNITINDSEYKQIKNEMYDLAQNLKNSDDVRNLLAQVELLGNNNQKEELSSIIRSAARINGLQV